MSAMVELPGRWVSCDYRGVHYFKDGLDADSTALCGLCFGDKRAGMAPHKNMLPCGTCHERKIILQLGGRAACMAQQPIAYELVLTYAVERDTREGRGTEWNNTRYAFRSNLKRWAVKAYLEDQVLFMARRREKASACEVDLLSTDGRIQKWHAAVYRSLNETKDEIESGVRWIECIGREAR